MKAKNSFRGLMMHIKKENLIVLVAGCGQYGSCIASQLDQSGESVVGVDLDQQAFDRLAPNYTGVTVVGDASDIEVLRLCGIDKSKAVISVTSDDNINLMIAQIASEIYEVPMIVSKVSDSSLSNVEATMNITVYCPARAMTQVVMDSLILKEGQK